MDKVGIVTIIDNTNYGNRLQNYALTKILTDLGKEVFTIKNVPYREYRYVFSKYSIKKHLMHVFYAFNKKKLHEREIEKWCMHYQSTGQRKKNFDRFNQLIVFSKKWLSEYNLTGIDEKFDAVISGSDQVFNYKYGRANYIDFLAFANNKNKISYAASLGIDNIPPKQITKYKHYLIKFDNLSFREKTATELISKYIKNKKILTVCDPTFLLLREEWEQLCKFSIFEKKEKYITKMYYGKSNKKIEDAISEYSKDNNLDVIELNNKGITEYYEFGPYEFLNCIRNSEIVFSDSFHVCVFCIIFHVNFYVTRREGDDESIFSRLSDLLQMYDYVDRIFTGGPIENIDTERFEKSDSIIKKERSKGIEYLKRVLK